MLAVHIMDEFVEPIKETQKKGMRGILAEYADPNLAQKEKSAWEQAMIEKYGNS